MIYCICPMFIGHRWQISHKQRGRYFYGLVTSCYGHKTVGWRPACCWLRWGSISTGDSNKGLEWSVNIISKDIFRANEPLHCSLQQKKKKKTNIKNSIYSFFSLEMTNWLIFAVFSIQLFSRLKHESLTTRDYRVITIVARHVIWTSACTCVTQCDQIGLFSEDLGD